LTSTPIDPRPFQYKSSRVGDRYQADIPELLDGQERTEDSKYQHVHGHTEDGHTLGSDTSFVDGERMEVEYHPVSNTSSASNVIHLLHVDMFSAV
jgi:hypothetical protein